MLADAAPVSAVLIANELRSESVQSRFMEVFKAGFTIKKIPHSKLNADYRHPSILLYSLKRRNTKSHLSSQAGRQGDGVQ